MEGGKNGWKFGRMCYCGIQAHTMASGKEWKNHTTGTGINIKNKK